jgi:hypothetical protein
VFSFEKFSFCELVDEIGFTSTCQTHDKDHILVDRFESVHFEVILDNMRRDAINFDGVQKSSKGPISPRR